MVPTRCKCAFNSSDSYSAVFEDFYCNTFTETRNIAATFETSIFQFNEILIEKIAERIYRNMFRLPTYIWVKGYADGDKGVVRKVHKVVTEVSTR